MAESKPRLAAKIVLSGEELFHAVYAAAIKKAETLVGYKKRLAAVKGKSEITVIMEMRIPPNDHRLTSMNAIVEVFVRDLGVGEKSLGKLGTERSPSELLDGISKKLDAIGGSLDNMGEKLDDIGDMHKRKPDDPELTDDPDKFPRS
jgi:hypothetical protein